MTGAIDTKTFNFMVKWIDADNGSLSGYIDLELKGVHVDEVAPGGELSYLFQQAVKVLDILEVAVSTAL